MSRQGNESHPHHLRPITQSFNIIKLSSLHFGKKHIRMVGDLYACFLLLFSSLSSLSHHIIFSLSFFFFSFFLSLTLFFEYIFSLPLSFSLPISLLMSLSNTLNKGLELEKFYIIIFSQQSPNYKLLLILILTYYWHYFFFPLVIANNLILKIFCEIIVKILLIKYFS